MKVSFSFGPKSPKIIESMVRTVDDVEFSSYDSIQGMLDASTSRHVFFDRIVFSEKILNDVETDLYELSDYIKYYSDSTEVVIVCNSQGSKALGVFNEVFNSPLYTAVLVDKVTIKTLLEFVVSSISELRAKYYVLDEKKALGVTSKSVDDSTVEVKEETKKSSKKGFLSGLFGKKGDTSSSQEIEDSSTSVMSEETETTKTEEEYSQAVEEYPQEVEETSTVDSEDDLSVGYLGGEHVDTGYLDEESISEIDNYFEESSSKEYDWGRDIGKEIIEDSYSMPTLEEVPSISPVVHEESELGMPTADDTYQEGSNLVEESFSTVGGTEDLDSNTTSLDSFSSGKFHLFIGDRNLGVSSSVVDLAKELSSKGSKVLVVDADYAYSRLLSCLDVIKFYGYSFNGGLCSLNPYEEDGIHYLSNGYGYNYDSCSVGLDRLIESELANEYDVILIDCPLDCITALSSDFLVRCKCTIQVGGTKSAVSRLVTVLTDRSIISTDVQDILYDISNIEVVGVSSTFNEDLAFLRKLCLFGRGNWLNKIG